jgi:hypothetical protein
MTGKESSEQDAFRFGLKGVRAIASYHAMPAAGPGAINRAWDRRFSENRERRPGDSPPRAAGRVTLELIRRLRRAA